jgi:hypothetical protein
MEMDARFYRRAAEGGPAPAHQPRVSMEQAVGEFNVDARIKAAMSAGVATEDDYIRITEIRDIGQRLIETEKWAHLVPKEK